MAWLQDLETSKANPISLLCKHCGLLVVRPFDASCEKRVRTGGGEGKGVEREQGRGVIASSERKGKIQIYIYIYKKKEIEIKVNRKIQT